MSMNVLRQFGVFFDKYYWQTAVLIARNGLARQYRNSFLGILWTLLQPLAMVLVYAMVMPLIMRSPTNNYALYIMVSLPIWSFFSITFNNASQSIIANGEVLKRCMISSTVFPVADVLRNTYTFFTAFCVIYGVALIFNATFSPLILLIPLYFIPVLMTMSSMAIAIAFIAPYLRDVGELITLSMTMLFWLTPVAYSFAILPAWAQTWMKLNPFFIMMHPIQMLAYEHVLPGIDDVLRLGVLTTIAIVFGFTIFRVCRRNYVYYL